MPWFRRPVQTGTPASNRVFDRACPKARESLALYSIHQHSRRSSPSVAPLSVIQVQPSIRRTNADELVPARSRTRPITDIFDHRRVSGSFSSQGRERRYNSNQCKFTFWLAMRVRANYTKLLNDAATQGAQFDHRFQWALGFLHPKGVVCNRQA